MAVSLDFQTEVDKVDASKVLTFAVDASYDDDEWSYDGLEITANGDLGHEMGTSELLYQMGFRFYGPDATHDNYIFRPATVADDLTAIKQKFWLPDIRIWEAYGHSFAEDPDLKAELNTAHDKWQTLNAAGTNRFKNGHRWTAIQGNHTAYLTTHSTMLINGNHFNLGLAVSDAAEYDLMVELCAADLLNEGLNEWNNTNFDPTDGDGHTSDEVFQFAIDVCIKVRAGTTAISTLSAQAGVSDAKLGVYAYGGHRLPPSMDLKPYVYTQVALGFSSAGLGYPELVTQHGAVAVNVGLREYFDVMHWSWSQPWGGRKGAQYYDVYDTYQAAGAISANGEFNANWLVNMVAINHGMRKMKTGVSDITDMVTEIVDNLMGGDPKAHELFTFWHSNADNHNKFTLRRSFDLINDMQAGWFKSRLMELMVILELHRAGHPSYGWSGTAPEFDDDLFEDLMRKIYGVRANNITHVYAWERRLANSNVRDTSPALWMYADPIPDWMANPLAPTAADFITQHASLTAITNREDALYTDDLVLVDVTPTIAATPVADCYYIVESKANFIYIGPGNVTFARGSGADLSTSFYGPGRHNIEFKAGKASDDDDYFMYWDAGICFMNLFYGIRAGPTNNASIAIPAATNSGHWWMYFHHNILGSAMDFDSGTRIRVEGTWGQEDIGVDGIAANILHGQNKIINGQIAGDQYPGNTIPYLSPNPYKALMPRAIAEQEFPNSTKIVSN